MNALLFAVLLSAAPGHADVVEPPVSSVTLPEAIDRALERSPRVASVRAAVQRAEALVVQSRATWLPTLSLNGTFTQLEGNRGLGDRVLLPAQSGGANLQLNVPLLSAPRWVSTQQAQLAVDASTEDEKDVTRMVTSLVGRAWLAVQLQHKLVAVAERARATSAEQLELATLRLAGGLGTRLDLVRAHREVSDNEGRLARANAELTTSREVLGVVLGERGPVDITGTPELSQLPAPSELAHVITARPDVTAAEHRVALAQRAVDTSWTDYLPTAGLLVQPTAQTPATPTQPSLGVTAQVTGQLVLFDGLARSGVRKEREASLAQARAQADDVRQRAESDLRLALQVLSLRDASARAASASAKWALEAEGLARAAWKEGASTNIELIEAERGARDAESLAEVARTAKWAAELELLVAAGRRPTR